MKKETKQLFCRILTFGYHWWKYYPGEPKYIHCRICGKLPSSMWEVYERMCEENPIKMEKILDEYEEKIRERGWSKNMARLKCPKCKCRVIVVTLTSNPVKYECQCSHCDFGLKYSMRNNPSVPFTQNELDDNFEAVNLS